VILTGTQPPPPDDGQWYTDGDKTHAANMNFCARPHVPIDAHDRSMARRYAPAGLAMIEDGCTLVMDKAPWHNRLSARPFSIKPSSAWRFLPAASGK